MSSDDVQPQETDAYLVIPDITGYTRFMQLPHTSIEHSQRGISALLASLVEAAGQELVASKTEGDAVLFYRSISQEDASAEQERRLIGCITRMIGAFYKTRDRLADELTPGCHACDQLRDLDLKIVLHRGRILIHEVLARREISGPAVILAHRLLAVARDQPRRMVVTDQVDIGMSFPFPTKCRRDTAAVDGIGEVGIRIISFNPAELPDAQSAHRAYGV